MLTLSVTSRAWVESLQLGQMPSISSVTGDFLLFVVALVHNTTVKLCFYSSATLIPCLLQSASVSGMRHHYGQLNSLIDALFLFPPLLQHSQFQLVFLTITHTYSRKRFFKGRRHSSQEFLVLILIILTSSRYQQGHRMQAYYQQTKGFYKLA